MATAVKIPKLSASVGQSPRTGKGPDPKNKSEDVKAVQQLLKLVGINVPTSGRCDAGTIDAIKGFQKKSGFKWPDGVIDPDQRTWKKLVATAKKKATPAEIEAALGGGGEATVPVTEFEFRGVKYLLTKQDYEKAVAEAAKRLMPVALALESQHKMLDSLTRDMNKTIQGGDGMMQAICAWASSKWAGLDPPNFKNQGKSLSAVTKAKNAVAKKQLGLATKLLPQAQKAVTAYDKEFADYRTKLIGGAGGVITALEFTRDTSFEIAETICVAWQMSKGSSEKRAKASSAALFAMLKSGATQYGEHMVDPKKGWDARAQQVAIDMLVATANSLISSGMNEKGMKSMGEKLANSLGKVRPFAQIGKAKTAEYLKKVLLSPKFIQIAKTSMQQIVKTAGEGLKKGRGPTGSEITKQLQDALASVVSEKIAKQFDLATWKYSKSLKEVFSDKEAKKLGDWFAKLPKTKRAKVLHDIFKKNEEAIIKFGLTHPVAVAAPTATPDKIAKDAVKHSLNDKDLLALIKGELKDKERKSK